VICLPQVEVRTLKTTPIERKRFAKKFGDDLRYVFLLEIVALLGWDSLGSRY